MSNLKLENNIKQVTFSTKYIQDLDISQDGVLKDYEDEFISRNKFIYCLFYFIGGSSYIFLLFFYIEIIGFDSLPQSKIYNFLDYILFHHFFFKDKISYLNFNFK